MHSKLIADFEAAHSATIIYLTINGSRLYGTHTESSDTDYIGLFVPSSDSLLTKSDTEHWTYSSGNATSKNDVNDVDITFWSIQKFLYMLQRGETGALDLLFSMKATPTIQFTTPIVATIYDYATKQLLSSNTTAFLGYAVGQAQRYGVKGARYEELVRFTEYITQLTTTFPNYKLLELHPMIAAHIDAASYNYISLREAPGPKGHTSAMMTYVDTHTKLHASDITIETLQARCVEKLDYAGNRTKAASTGTDWKSLSNAYRVLVELHELLQTGSINFPLKHAELVLEVKQGKLPQSTVIGLLQEGIDEIDELVAKSMLPPSVPTELVHKLILSIYKD